MNCERCGAEAERLYEASDRNEDDEVITKKLCWSCDHDVMNGGDFYLDAGIILMDRAENDYAYDPINTEKPSWLP